MLKEAAMPSTNIRAMLEALDEPGLVIVSPTTEGPSPPTGLMMSPWWPTVCARMIARLAVTMRLYGFFAFFVAWQITVL